MAYSGASLNLMTQSAGQVGCKLWVLDTVDGTTTVDTAGYISDAKARGMLKGDIVIVRIWTTAIPAATSELQTAAASANILTATGLHFVIGVDATTGAADLTNVLAITATNSD